MIAKWINHSNNNALGRIKRLVTECVCPKSLFWVWKYPLSSLATEICDKKPPIQNLAPNRGQYR